MTVQGDLASLALSDFFQNLETQQRSGTLSLTLSQGPVQIYFDTGAVALLASPTRPALFDTIAASGLVTERGLERVRSKRRGSGKSLCDVLIQQKLVSAEALRQFASEMLSEDLCDLISEAVDGTFRFEEGRPPARVFDPEERCLELRVPVGPLLLEAARRSDHWTMIRERVPSDTAHYCRVADAPLAEDFPDPEVGQALLEAFDGSRSVAEVAASIAVPRFRAYCATAELVSRQRLRAATSNDLAERARQLASTNPEKAVGIVDAALETAPHDVSLLELSATVSERVGDEERAADAHRTLAHIARQAEDGDTALAHLEKARALKPKDSAILERKLDLEIERQNRDGAVADGLELVEMYRGPGLHQKARVALEKLLGDDEHTPTIALELARTLADTGEVATAITLLGKLGRRLIARREESKARELFEAARQLDPNDEETRRWIEQIDTQAFERRRARRKRMLRQAALFASICLFAVLFGLDVRARLAYASTASEISAAGLVEAQKYEQAISKLDAVRREHPFAIATWLEARQRVADLTDRASANRGASSTTD